MDLLKSKRIVLKIGSALLVDAETSTLHEKWLYGFIEDVAMLANAGMQVVIVSSGATAIGKLHLNLLRKHLSLEVKQAAAAVGQIQLSYMYQSLLAKKGFKTAQILLTLEDSEHRRRFLNARNTFETLLDMGIIPIVNENDTVATAEMRYGDNDRLAARVAQMINADTLVLLSDIDGLYTADPKINPEAEFITVVTELTEAIFDMGKGSSTHYGSGGMTTKLLAAKIAVNSGCRMLITTGNPLNPINHFLSSQRGTWFIPQTSLLSAKKAWLSEHLQPMGTLFIDDGAVKALIQGKSLLPIGIKSISGRFQKGDAIKIANLKQEEIGRGLCNYTEQDLHKIIGRASDEFAAILGYEGSHEAVHRDNLVLFKR